MSSRGSWAERLHRGQADGVELAPASATFCTPTLSTLVVFSRGFPSVFKTIPSKMVFNLFTKGRLSSLAAHNGISLRKSDEEESVFLGGLTIGRVTCCFLRAGGTSQRNTTAVLCLSLTHIHTPEHLYCR